MDNISSFNPQQQFQTVYHDEFLSILNDSQANQQQVGQQPSNDFGAQDFQNYFNEGKNQEQRWMFGQFEMKVEESPPEINNPFFENLQIQQEQRKQRSDSFFGPQQLDLHIQSPQQYNKQMIREGSNKKEQDIIMNNYSLFQANQSKSIYLSKISTLIEKNAPNTIPSPQSPQQKIQDKIFRKTSNGTRDSESSLEQRNNQQNNILEVEDPLQQKLAKNRESARNSRKRKKVYVELLENKVTELIEQINKVEAICFNQKKQIEYFNQQFKISNLFATELQLVEDLGEALKNNQPVDSILKLMELQTGVNSQVRMEACDYMLQSLIQYTQTTQMKAFYRTSQIAKGLFASSDSSIDSQIQNIRQQLYLEGDQLDIMTTQLCQQYQSIRNRTIKVENIEQQLINLISPKSYAKHLISIHKDCWQDYIKQKSLTTDQYMNYIKLEDLSQLEYQRKQVKML